MGIKARAGRRGRRGVGAEALGDGGGGGYVPVGRSVQ